MDFGLRNRDSKPRSGQNSRTIRNGLEDVVHRRGKKDDPLAGSVNDPQIKLIGVEIHQATFFAVDRATPIVMYEMAKGWLTGTAPESAK